MQTAGRLVLVAIFAAFTQLPALASGGLWCWADDKDAKFQVDAGLSSGGGLFNFRGDLDVRSGGTPEAFRKLRLADDDLIQWWIDEKELRLWIYREQQDAPHGILRLVIKTKLVDEGSYAGTYDLKIAVPKDNVETGVIDVSGQTSCGAE